MSRDRVTEFLGRWESGGVSDMDALLPVIYEELRGLARHYLRAERADHILQPIALVHEAYLRLMDQERVAWRERGCAVNWGSTSEAMPIYTFVRQRLKPKVEASHGTRGMRQHRRGGVSKTGFWVDLKSNNNYCLSCV